MAKIFAVLCLFLVISCRPKSYDVTHHKFDQQVIDKIPLYDSLVQLLVKNFPSVKDHIRENLSYEYEPYWDSVDLYKKFPREEAEKIDKAYHRLGDKFFSAFNIYKDSSVRISVRDYYIKEHQVTAREYLSYYPNGASRKERDFLFKDTVVDKNWLYWIVFDE